MTAAWAHSGPATASSARAAAAPSDYQLIQKIASGDRLAMRSLFARHRVPVYRWLLRIVRDASLAEDLLSETFLEVWRQAERFEARSSVATWLLAIARHRAISALRRRRPEAEDEAAAATCVDPADDPEIALDKKLRAERVRHALGMLSRDHREVIDLVYYHDRSVKEVAGILAIPEATVKTRMFYARNKLATLIDRVAA
jgi:RNA polymerase sigma-70 factor (ECF subfamily)